jgi:hypothetical protein
MTDKKRDEVTTTDMPLGRAPSALDGRIAPSRLIGEPNLAAHVEAEIAAKPQGHHDLLRPMTTLTGGEVGVWFVYTMGSTYVFDFDAGTIERLPGPNTAVYPYDPPRMLRTIERCVVGAPGVWTIVGDQVVVNFSTQTSSQILVIEREGP